MGLHAGIQGPKATVIGSGDGHVTEQEPMRSHWDVDGNAGTKELPLLFVVVVVVLKQ